MSSRNSGALGLKHGTVVVLDKRGGVLWRERTSGKGRVSAGALAFLEQDWPPFIAVQRVSVAKARFRKEPKVLRNLARAKAEIRIKNYKRARSLLSKALQFNPEHVEVRRQLAVTMGFQRDLAGVLNAVEGWRESFGDLAAESLLVEVISRTKIPDLEDPRDSSKNPAKT